MENLLVCVCVCVVLIPLYNGAAGLGAANSVLVGLNHGGDVWWL